MSSSETIPVRHAWIEPGVEGVLFTAARSGSGGHIIPVKRFARRWTLTQRPTRASRNGSSL